MGINNVHLILILILVIQVWWRCCLPAVQQMFTQLFYSETDVCCVYKPDKRLMTCLKFYVVVGRHLRLCVHVGACLVDSVWLCLVVWPDSTRHTGSTSTERVCTPRRPEHSNSPAPLCSSCLEMQAVTNKVSAQN